MGKSTISMAIFNSYVSLPEGIWYLWYLWYLLYLWYDIYDIYDVSQCKMEVSSWENHLSMNLGIIYDMILNYIFIWHYIMIWS